MYQVRHINDETDVTTEWTDLPSLSDHPHLARQIDAAWPKPLPDYTGVPATIWREYRVKPEAITVSAEQFAELEQLLTEDPVPQPKLVELLRRPSVFDEES